MSRRIKETNRDVSLKIERIPNSEEWIVSGRGELHLSILIENMRREGYELQVSKPKVIIKEVSNDTMKFVLMAFDEGTGLTPHRAPGNAIIFALEGKAVIDYEGKDYTISAGENFRFDKNGLHSVTADGRFKMGLLLVLE